VHGANATDSLALDSGSAALQRRGSSLQRGLGANRPKADSDEGQVMRVCGITNGRFVEAEQEWRWLAVRLLWSNPAGRFGSGLDRRLAELTAAKQPLRLGSRETVHRQQTDSTRCDQSFPAEADSQRLVGVRPMPLVTANKVQASISCAMPHSSANDVAELADGGCTGSRFSGGFCRVRDVAHRAARRIIYRTLMTTFPLARPLST